MNPRPIVIVTGGAGFIGSHMVDLLLEKGNSVRVIDNLVGGREANLEHLANDPNLTLDLRDIRSLGIGDSIFSGARQVFHFAGIGDIVPSIENPLEYLSTNVQGTANILEGARHAGVEKFVYAASSSCYGLADTPTREDNPIRPMYPYALSKYQGEQAAFHWWHVYGVPVNSVRIFNAYGTRSRTSGAYGSVFGVFLKQKLAGTPFTVVGDGTQSRDFIYASDVAKGFLAIAEEAPPGEAYNIGTGNPQPVNRIIELLGGEKVHIPKRPGEPDCTHADITKITNAVNWKPEVSFEEGVGKVIEHIDYWKEAPLWNPDSIATATKAWFDCLGNRPHE